MTTPNTLSLTAVLTDREAPLSLNIENVVIAGWTGRDQAAMEAHIQELEALGIPRPSATPTFYRVGANLLTTAPHIDVTGDSTSGEAEAVLFSEAGGLWVGVGSDHTDRLAETFQVTVAKQACPKPIAPQVWKYEDVLPHWDELILRSYALIDGERILYQEGSISALRPPDELAARYSNSGNSGKGLAAGTAMFCGTLAVHGAVRPAEQFEVELDDPVLKRKLSHHYTIRPLPVAG